MFCHEYNCNAVVIDINTSAPPKGNQRNLTAQSGAEFNSQGATMVVTLSRDRHRQKNPGARDNPWTQWARLQGFFKSESPPVH